MGQLVLALIVVAAVAVIVGRGIALYNYSFHKKDL